MGSTKKYIFRFITLQRRNYFGKFLSRISKSLQNALENKMNDNELSGEYRVLRILAKSNPKVVFDVGANMGFWTKELKKYSSKSEVYLFEPVPETFSVLTQNLEGLPNLNFFQLALSNSVETLDFKYYPDNSYFSSIYSSFSNPNFKLLKVEALNGDEFCYSNNVDSIDILKIDVEGAEEKVLEGFARMIGEQKIRVIQFEYGPFNIESRVLLKDFYNILKQNGYRVGKIYPKWIDWSEYSIEKENFILSNFIAISRNDSSIFELLENA